MFLDIDGHRVFTLSFGAGPRAFLAHSAWIGNNEDWIATLAIMSRQWRTVAYDHRGTGETKVPVEAISADALRDDIFRVMDALDIERCVLGGFSAGTSIVLRAALLHPERFEGLVLMNGAAGVQLPGVNPPPAPSASLPSQSWPGSNYSERLRWFIEQCTPEPDVEHIRRWGHDILLRAEPEAADRLWQMRFADQVDFAACLPKLAIPTLLIHGELDVFADVAKIEYVSSLIPGSKLVVMEGSGHLPAMTRPADVAAAIESFFASAP
ncbi:MAG: alpha/beta hydrolase [Chloroflexi bacterium]|nr:alpha/beta hydrolase [Chloroflexota bacterium]